MCMLCSVQRWSRRAAAVLPWVVVPLIGLWALSQLLPPPLRLEVSYPRLACVLVLVATLCWYELLLPRLADWRERRAAAHRRRQLSRAAELHRLRRAATRRCRNCLAPYRDQRPSGRFTCASCGHVSRRPVLDLPAGPDATVSGLLAGWFPSHAADDHLSSSDKTHAAAVLFVFKLLSWAFSGVSWFGRLVFRSSGHLSNAEHRESAKKEENVGSSPESRGDKARRKAEEKRQARLEKEMLEEEERKQREEVAKLVEERRKLRDEKLEAERRRLENARRNGGGDGERRRQERRKGSIKSCSDGGEHEKKSGSERRCDFDRKSEKGKTDSRKAEAGQGTKVAGNKPGRYFDRVKGSLLSSSRGFRGANLFGRSSRASVAPATQVTQSIGGLADHGKKHDGRSAHSNAEHARNENGRAFDTKSNSTMGLDMPLRQTAPKKSWLSLFTRSSTVYPCSDASGTNCINQNSQVEAQAAQLTNNKLLPDNCLDNQFTRGRSFPFPVYTSHANSNSVSHLASGSMFLHVDERRRNVILEEADVFEDPCYVPDPVSLLGPVSESLDCFPLDLGLGFLANNKLEEPRVHKNVHVSTEMDEPSPIKFPVSRLQVPQEKRASSVLLPHNLMSRHLNASELDDPSNKQEHGTWKMWSSPLAQEALGLIGGPNWNLSPGLDKSIQGDMLHPLSHNHMMSQLSKENHALPSTVSFQNVHPGKLQNGSPFAPLGSNLNGSHKPTFQPFPVEQKQISPLDPVNYFIQNDIALDQSNKSASSHQFEPSFSSWSKRDWVQFGPPDGGSLTTGRLQSPVGSPFPTNADEHSFLS